MRLRALVSALCIILATLLVPFGVISGWAKAQLIDETTFVTTFAPLASDPAVQNEVTFQVMAVIEREIDIDGLTASVFDGITELGLSDRASVALNLLQQPAAEGVRTMLHGGVSEFVYSELFAQTWEVSLRASHRALVAAATQDSLARGAVTVDQRGEIAIQLGPIIEEVKTSLGNAGFGLAAAIPVVEASFVVAQSDALPLIGLVYALISVLGWWLPLISLALFVLGVLIARSRPGGIGGAGIGMIFGATGLLFVFALADVLMRVQSTSLGVSAAALDAVLSQTLSGMRATSWVLVILGVVLLIAAVSQGRSAGAVAMRASVARLNEGLRRWLSDLGFRTGSFGRWLAANRGLTGVLVVVGAIIALVLLPLTTAAVVWVTVAALIIRWLLAVCESMTPAEEVLREDSKV